jgi:hypothetical protein
MIAREIRGAPQSEPADAMELGTVGIEILGED